MGQSTLSDGRVSLFLEYYLGREEEAVLDEKGCQVLYENGKMVGKPKTVYITQETAETLNAVINELPHKTKLAFHLVPEDKMKYKDAVEILGVSLKLSNSKLPLQLQS